MMQVRTTIRVPLDVALKCGCDFTVRPKWDNVLYELISYEKTADLSYLRCSYCFKAPVMISDREFYLEQVIRKDYPEPGLTCMIADSLPINDTEFPMKKGRVRGDINIAIVFKPIMDPVTGNEHTEIVMTNRTDINGLVPKWLVNTMSRSVPRVWFKTYELGCFKYMEEVKKIEHK